MDEGPSAGAQGELNLDPKRALHASLDREAAPLSEWSTLEAVPDDELALAMDASTEIARAAGVNGRCIALLTRYPKPEHAVSWLLKLCGFSADVRRVITPALVDRCVDDGSSDVADEAETLPVFVFDDLDCGGGSFRALGEVRVGAEDTLTQVRRVLEAAAAPDPDSIRSEATSLLRNPHSMESETGMNDLPVESEDATVVRMPFTAVSAGAAPVSSRVVVDLSTMIDRGLGGAAPVSTNPLAGGIRGPPQGSVQASFGEDDDTSGLSVQAALPTESGARRTRRGSLLPTDAPLNFQFVSATNNRAIAFTSEPVLPLMATCIGVTIASKP